VLFIFDQAEQLTVRSEAEINWLRDFIATILKSDEVRCAIVIRQDFYFGLRFLCDLLPSPEHVIELHGIITSTASFERHEIHHALTRVCTEEVAERVIEDLEIPLRETHCAGAKRLTTAIRVILPLELQMLGFILDIESQRSGIVAMDTYRHRLLQKNGVIRRYFLTYLNACDNPDIAWSVLFALSTDSVVQRSVSMDHLERVTYYGREEIKKVLDLFQQHKLVITPQPGIYEWSHDALWTGFREISASEMDPALRDNINYLAERYHQSRAVKSIILAAGDREVKRREHLIQWGLLIATVIITVRMSRDYNSLKLPSLESRSFYLPFGFAHLLWAIYLYRVRWLYIRISKSLDSILGWWLAPAAGVGCAIAGFVWPRSWLYGLGVTAVILGLWLSVPSRRQDLSSQSRLKFWALARDCFLFGFLICGVVGSWYFIYVDELGRTSFFVVSIGLGFAFSLFAYLTMRERSSPSSVTTYLGFLDRTFQGASDGSGAARLFRRRLRP
jgi:hypothetical protein